MTTEQTVPPTDAAGRVPQTLPAVLRTAIASHSGVAMRSPDPRDPHALSYADVGRAADEIAGGLAALGVQPGDRVAILASTRAEWALADLGALWAGATVVPIYNTNSAEECQYVLAHSGSRVVFCEDAAQLAKIDSIGAHCPDLEHRVVLTGSAPGAMTLDALRERGRALDEPVAAARTAAMQPRRRGHDRLHVGHDRAAQGLHAHARQHAGHDRPLPGPAGAGRRDGRLPLPATRARPGPRDADGRADRRRDHRLLARRPQADRRRAGRGAPDALPLGPAHLREDPHRRPGRRGGAGAAQAARSSPGRWRRAGGRRLARGRASPRARSRAGVTPSPTASCCPRSAASSATACTWRSPAPRRSAPRSSSSSTPAACSCSRATG